MRLDALPEQTRRVFERARTIKTLSPYLLIGGTALALQDGHRESEDLDFVSPSAALDRSDIRSLVEDLATDDMPQLITSDFSRQEFENDGFDIDDVHQDWLVDGVKITFFAPQDDEERRVCADTPRVPVGEMSIMDAEGIFLLKSMVILRRRTSRDTFDLWHFVEHRDKTVADIVKSMGRGARHFGLDAKLDRIAPSRFNAADPGFSTTMADAPRTPDELIQRMATLIATFRRNLAAEHARLVRGPDPHSSQFMAADKPAPER